VSLRQAMIFNPKNVAADVASLIVNDKS